MCFVSWPPFCRHPTHALTQRATPAKIPLLFPDCSCAKTGSGKTLAYLLPMFRHIRRAPSQNLLLTSPNHNSSLQKKYSSSVTLRPPFLAQPNRNQPAYLATSSCLCPQARHHHHHTDSHTDPHHLSFALHCPIAATNPPQSPTTTTTTHTPTLTYSAFLLLRPPQRPAAPQGGRRPHCPHCGAHQGAGHPDLPRHGEVHKGARAQSGSQRNVPFSFRRFASLCVSVSLLLRVHGS